MTALNSSYTQIDVAASADQLEIQLKISEKTFGNDVSVEVNRLRQTITQKPSLFVAGSDDKASDLVKDPAAPTSSTLPPQTISRAAAAVSTSKSSAPLQKRPKIIFDDDADDDIQDSDAVNVKKQTSQREVHLVSVLP